MRTATRTPLSVSSLGLTKTLLQYMLPFQRTSCADIELWERRISYSKSNKNVFNQKNKNMPFTSASTKIFSRACVCGWVKTNFN